ncbi:MAG: Rne/Rng family ribonuclease [Deltaproteobacteria bacterium]|nr:Rne/Rng family ribonuclease [Deltaproteobacteria bacterium]
MAKEMIFNCSDNEVRIAILENHHLTNLYIERTVEKSIAGNIYLGRVVRVLPGMQAAFVDIGLDRAAFLHVSDTFHDFSELELLMSDEELTEREIIDLEQKWYSREPGYQIEDILKEGQEILVQIAKEPLGTKGARITTYISLPGRKLVLMPTVQHIGISRQITDENERARLKKILEGLRPDGHGLIARTVSEGKSEEDLKGDVEYLTRVWETIKLKKEHVAAPGLVHADLGITLRAMRDFFTEDVEQIVIDSKSEFEKIREFMDTYIPAVTYNLKLYEEDQPVFDTFGIELDIKRALNNKVWLKSGGYIIIEETEALCAVDVNTGKYVGKRNLEDTILNTNLEAAKEIAYQIRLRNIGGIIIIDFIDMESELNREKVFTTLVEEMGNDKSKTKIQKISELGLIEMTRQRKGKSLQKVMCEPCPCCEGLGVIKSTTTVCYEIFRELMREKTGTLSRMICVLVHPDVADRLLQDEKNTIERLERELGKKIIIKVDHNLYPEYYQIMPLQ